MAEEVLRETTDLLNHVDEYSDRLNAIGKKAALSVRIGVVDCVLTDQGNPIPDCIRATKEKYDGMRVRVGVYDYLDCLSELRSRRLDLTIVGLTEREKLPDDFEAIKLFDEMSHLYCSPTHPCADIVEEGKIFDGLKASRISAHRFFQNPIDETLDLLLSGENAEIAQGNIESTVYLALAGTHVGLMPDHFAEIWVQRGQLVQIATSRLKAVSSFHAVRLKSAQQNAALTYLWERLGQ